jgi:hypothetical protein
MVLLRKIAGELPAYGAAQRAYEPAEHSPDSGAARGRELSRQRACRGTLVHARTDASGLREGLEPLLIRAKEGKGDEQVTRLVHAQFDDQRKYPVENQMAKLGRAVHIE